MYLLIGLGNPSKKYSRNRHNVGFQFLDFFAQKYQEDFPNNLNRVNKFEQNRRFSPETLMLNQGEKSFLLAKPQTYMNDSGTSVKKLIYYYKASPDNLFVAHDDLDIPLGKFKIQKGSGPPIHKGLLSIEENLGTKNFWRIRIGVDNRPADNRIPGETYVLQDFIPKEETTLQTVFEDIYKRLKKELAI